MVLTALAVTMASWGTDTIVFVAFAAVCHALSIVPTLENTLATWLFCNHRSASFQFSQEDIPCIRQDLLYFSTSQRNAVTSTVTVMEVWFTYLKPTMCSMRSLMLTQLVSLEIKKTGSNCTNSTYGVVISPNQVDVVEISASEKTSK